MRNKFSIYLIPFLFFIQGCESTGGIIGGLFPAPKFLKGDITNNIYTSKEKKFSIQVPHKEGSYEYTYLNIKEQYNEHGTYISFGPAAFDKSIYRRVRGRRYLKIIFISMYLRPLTLYGVS